MHMRLLWRVAKALHIQGLVVETTEVGAVVSCNNKQVLVVAKMVAAENCIELGEVVVMVMEVDGKVQDVVMVVAVNALHKVVVVMAEAEAVLYRGEVVVAVLYKVEEMVVVVNGLVEVESEQEEVGAVTDRDRLEAAVSAVGAVSVVEAVSVVGEVEVSFAVAVVDYSSIAQVVVGRTQDLVEVEVMAEGVKVVAETLHNKLVRAVAVKVAAVKVEEEVASRLVVAGMEEEEGANRLAVAGMAEVVMVAVVKVGVEEENILAVAVKAEVVKVAAVEAVEAAVEANTLEVVVVASTPAVVAEGNGGHKQATVAAMAMVVTEEEEAAM